MNVGSKIFAMILSSTGIGHLGAMALDGAILRVFIIVGQIQLETTPEGNMNKSPTEILNNVSEHEINRALESITEDELIAEMKNQADRMSQEQLQRKIKKAGTEENFINNFAQIAMRFLVMKKVLMGAGIAGSVAVSTAQAAVDASNVASVGGEMFDAASDASGGFLETMVEVLFG